jgi:benzoyl-CoA reductase subunit D
MSLTVGIDVGSSAIKVAAFRVEGEKEELLGLCAERIRRRDPIKVVSLAFGQVLEQASLNEKEIDYVASTGDGELVPFRRGHFYSMTTHARGAIHLLPESTGVLDAGALHGRAILMDPRSKVLGYRMTSQCASGSGQFLENIARYLGVGLAEVGPLSREGDQPEAVSGICAVLAETDVINMVSRGISTANIIQGIHISMASRFVKLLRSARVEGQVALTGGLSADVGLVDSIASGLNRTGAAIQLKTHEHSVYAGAIGAALWGAFRHEHLKRKRKVA